MLLRSTIPEVWSPKLPNYLRTFPKPSQMEFTSHSQNPDNLRLPFSLSSGDQAEGWADFNPVPRRVEQEEKQRVFPKGKFQTK